MASEVRDSFFQTQAVDQQWGHVWKEQRLNDLFMLFPFSRNSLKIVVIEPYG